MEQSHVRHGDVLLTRVDALPKGKAIVHKGEHILAYGEVTGHCHRLKVADPTDLQVVSHEGTIFLALLAAGTLTHEEHKTLEIQPGVYRMDFEREYDYALENMRQVID